MLQFITSCCSYRDNREYHEKTNRLLNEGLELRLLNLAHIKITYICYPEVSLSSLTFFFMPEYNFVIHAGFTLFESGNFYGLL